MAGRVTRTLVDGKVQQIPITPITRALQNIQRYEKNNVQWGLIVNVDNGNAVDTVDVTEGVVISNGVNKHVAATSNLDITSASRTKTVLVYYAAASDTVTFKTLATGAQPTLDKGDVALAYINRAANTVAVGEIDNDARPNQLWQIKPR